MTDTKEQTKPQPLHASWIHALKLADTDVGPTLSRRHKAVERGLTMRLQAGTHPDYPGVYVVDGYNAYATPPALPPSLDMAMAQDSTHQRFLLSPLPSGMITLTTRLNYPDRSSMRILPPTNRQLPWLEIHGYDYEYAFEDEQLIGVHLARLAITGGDPEAEYPAEIADQHFRHIIARAAVEL